MERQKHAESLYDAGILLPNGQVRMDNEGLYFNSTILS